jgi:alpha-mannosidase
LDDALRADLDAAVRQLARAVADPHPAAGRGLFVANPASFSRQVYTELPDMPAQAKMVESPPLGFAWIASEPAAAAPPPPPPRKWSLLGRRSKPEPVLAEEQPGQRPGSRQIALRNEFFTAVIDLQSGAIRSISDYHTRGPRLAQQLAMRIAPHAEGVGNEAGYSLMAADEVRIVSAGPVLGEALARGRLMARDGSLLAGYRQTTRVWRGSRVIELVIELEPERMPLGDPWNSYYAARFAWPDPEAKLFRSVNLAVVPTEAVQLESPHCIEVRTEKTRTTLLAGGLPYHGRCGQRKVDTLLVVQGETARQFRLGIAIDPPSGLAAALDFLAPPAIVSDSPPPGRSSGWLFHLDVRSVVATHWESMADGPGGFRVRLLETEGRAVTVNLRSFRALVSAEKLSPSGGPATSLSVEGDRVGVDLRPYEWAEVEGRFKAEGGKGKGEG